MPRKKPNVLYETTDEDTGKCEQVVEGDRLFVVLFENKPINIKTLNKFFDYPGARYKRTSFANEAHAYNLANRLNSQYNTDKFHVKVFLGDE